MNINELKILYEDNHIIVVIKEVGILSQADKTGDLDMLTLVKEYIKIKYNKPGNVYLGLVHRLDRMTGGVMVFAKTSKAAARLSEAIREHRFIKRYYACINKTIRDAKGTFIDHILVDEKTGMSKISSNGKLAKLDYQVISCIGNYSLVEIILYTGRHHQIRVQFASRGYALYGDTLYGRKEEKVPLSLYAYHLEFNHPTTKEHLVFEKSPDFGIWELFQLQK